MFSRIVSLTIFNHSWTKSWTKSYNQSLPDLGILLLKKWHSIPHHSEQPITNFTIPLLIHYTLLPSCPLYKKTPFKNTRDPQPNTISLSLFFADVLDYKEPTVWLLAVDGICSPRHQETDVDGLCIYSKDVHVIVPPFIQWTEGMQPELHQVPHL